MDGFFFFFNDTATTEIYTLSLHDALPILMMRPRFIGCEANMSSPRKTAFPINAPAIPCVIVSIVRVYPIDRKSTRLNSSHANISYAVFCLKKKKKRLLHFVR